MKGIIWVCVVGGAFWWLAISSSSREAVYRGAVYVVSRLASSVGIRVGRTPPARSEAETRALKGEEPSEKKDRGSQKKR